MPGVPTAARVNAEILRGGQPTSIGFHSLAKAGVKTVINLRLSPSAAIVERREVESLGMRYIEIPMSSYRSPTGTDVQRALSVLNDESQGPVFVHCEGGRDRTGMIVACYRMAHDHWTREQALAEARSCAARELHAAMTAFILQFQPPEK